MVPRSTAPLGHGLALDTAWKPRSWLAIKRLKSEGADAAPGPWVGSAGYNGEGEAQAAQPVDDGRQGGHGRRPVPTTVVQQHDRARPHSS
jgi:hypothetical protein